MAKLPNSFRQRNRTTRNFRDQLARLSADVYELTRLACLKFDGDPSHPSLRHHPLADRKTGHHQAKSFSVSITMQYRAVYVADSGVNVWYWIGTHAEYDRFTGSKH